MACSLRLCDWVVEFTCGIYISAIHKAVDDAQREGGLMVSYQVERAGGDSRWLKGVLTLYLVAVIASISAMELLSAILGLIVLFRVGMNFLSIRRAGIALSSGMDWRLLITVIVIIIGFVINPRDGQVNWRGLSDLSWVPLLYVLMMTLRFQFLNRAMLATLFAAASVISFYAITQFFTGYDMVRGFGHQMHSFGGYFRSVGLFNNPMTFAHSFVMLFFLPMAFSFVARSEARGFRMLANLSALLIAMSVVTSQTRGAWLGLIGGFLLTSYLYSRKVAAVAAALLATVGALVISFVPTFRARLLTVFDLSFDNNSTRIELWRANLDMFLDHPIWGVGYGQNVDLLPQYYAKLGIDSDFYSHAHNTYLHLLSGTGALGLLFYFLTIGWVFFISIGLLKKLSRGSFEWTLVLASIGAQCAFHIGGLTECNFEDSEVNHLFMLYIAVSLVVLAKWRSGIQAGSGTL